MNEPCYYLLLPENDKKIKSATTYALYFARAAELSATAQLLARAVALPVASLGAMATIKKRPASVRVKPAAGGAAVDEAQLPEAMGFARPMF